MGALATSGPPVKMNSYHKLAARGLPACDSLSSDFCKRFWNILGPDVLERVLECYRKGSCNAQNKIILTLTYPQTTHSHCGGLRTNKTMSGVGFYLNVFST